MPTSTTASTRRARSCNHSRRVRGWLLGLLTAASLGFAAGIRAADSVDAVLALPEAPFGVVFEIVEGEEDALDALLPRVRDAISRIRARFPQTQFAVVSHGREEFALQADARDEYPAIHREVESLVADEVPVHVCGTHASWYGVTPEDFPAYVDVAPTGPGQISLYRDLGYEVIVVD